MDFNELFGAFAILLIGVIAIGAMITTYGAEYGDTVGDNTGQFAQSLANVETDLTQGFVERGISYGNSTLPQEGQGASADQSDNLIARAWSSINLMRELVGLTPALMKDGAAAINLPSIYWRIGEALFWTIFSISLALLLVIGARRFIS